LQPNDTPEIEAQVARCLASIDRRDYADALRTGQQILAADPAHRAGIHIVGLAHLRLGNPQQALPLLQEVLRTHPQNDLLQWQIAQALQGVGEHGRALIHFDAAEALGIADAQLQQQRFDSALQLFATAGDWSQYDRVQRLVRHSVLASTRWVVGENALASPHFSNATLLQAAKNHAAAVMHQLPPMTPFQHQTPGRKIRLGFVGCDFYEQATSYLMTGFIESIDRNRFEVIAYEFGEEPASTPYRARVMQAYDRFVPIRDLSDEDAAARIHNDHIDILFSIKNPASTRLGIFARRPAAIQIHYLYYPGTSGMPFFDYLIADEVIVPQQLQAAYVGKIITLPGCYQPNDAKRPRARDTPRSDWALPEDAIVLANFGQTYKLTPDLFDLWCGILRRHPRCLLWLLSGDEQVRARLRQEATARGVEPQRLHFTEHTDTQQHLDRLRQADLVLDTFPYGGHTLSSDALWAGTPVLTRCGETFASRVAASLLTSVGMSELIASSELEYVSKIESLLQNPERLRHWRHHLDRGRERFDLFDSAAYADKFGAAMTALIELHWSSRGLRPSYNSSL
jgi:predicted O-linked N-acetylglucosamine transferase (SPINDLY family)